MLEIIIICIILLMLMKYGYIATPDMLKDVVGEPISSFSDRIAVLNPSDFGFPSIRGKKAIVVFGASWCGHCKKLLPTLDKLANLNTTNVLVAYVDAYKHDNIGREYGIEGYPTIKLFTGKEVLYYKGKNDLNSLTNLLYNLDADNYGAINA